MEHVEHRGASPVRTAHMVLLALLVVLGGGLVPAAAVAQTDEEAAKRAAREIQDARDRANAAADAYFSAESDLELLEDELLGLQRESVQLQATVDRLRRDVESVAVARFISSGTVGIPLLTGPQAPQDQVQAEVFVDVLNNSGTDVLDQYDIAQKRLAENQDEVRESQDDVESQQRVFLSLQEQAEDEVVRLRAIEADRLQDEAVQLALQAQLAADLARLEQQIEREAAAAARALPDPGAGLTTTTVPLPATTVSPAADAASNDATGDDSTTPATTTAPTTTEPPPPVTVATVPSSRGSSGGTSGGRTGTGGSGSNPTPINTGGTYVDAIVCPMPGSAYGDTWGAPRSGGRRHEGVDMLAPFGVPIYAVVDGFATFKSNRLGGNAVSLVGDNGNRYYYAHLQSYEGASRRVRQGDLIGYNGDTGNARGTPHLHFEVHPGGGLAVNPTPSVRAAGC